MCALFEIYNTIEIIFSNCTGVKLMIVTIVTTHPGSYKFTIRTKRKRTENANETNEKWTNASHERYETRKIKETKRRHDTRNERMIHERTKWNERTIWKTQTNERMIHVANERYTKRTNDTRTKESLEVTIYYPMTNDPGSIEVQYSIVLLFEWLLCKLMWLTNLIFYTQLIYI
jgi:hypothetical protein